MAFISSGESSRVYKYEVPSVPGTEFELELPKGAMCLSFRYQPGKGFVAWFAVEPAAACKISRKFCVVATGGMVHNVPGPLVHLGTDMTPDGEFVLHLFEIL